MKSKINLKHGRYFAVKGYQIVAGVTDAELAKALGITVRTLQNKRGGRSDFTASEALIMSKLLNTTQDQLFQTRELPGD